MRLSRLNAVEEVMMAQRQVTVIVDDLTGKELAADDAETVRFSLDGVHYELDTDHRAADRLRSALAPFVRAARRTGGHSGARRQPTRHSDVAADSRAVRAWAAANGIEINARGRISASVIEQYRAAGY